MTGKVLFIKNNPKGIYGFIKCQDGTTHYFDTNSIIKGNRLRPNSVVEFELAQTGDGKTKSINVRIIDSISAQEIIPTKNIDASIIATIKERLIQEISNHGYIPGGKFPYLLKESGIDNYKEYAQGIEAFINLYLSDDFELKKDEVIDGKRESNIIVQKAASSNNAIIEALFNEQKYVEILNSQHFKNATPLDLGINGVEIVLKALFKYLGENRDDFYLNDFHTLLLSAPTTTEIKSYKDDKTILEQGNQTAFVNLTLDDYSKVFENVYNGKKTINNNWIGIIERFWTAKSDLATYLTELWIIVAKKESCIDFYIDHASRENQLKHLPNILKVYSDFVISGKKCDSLRLLIKIAGHCFDANDMDTLVSSYEFFSDETLPEMTSVLDFVTERKKIESKDLISWFHSGIGEILAEKITNYYWWKESSDKLNKTIIHVLSNVLSDYQPSYYTAIIYNTSCPLFDREAKEKLLIENFKLICEDTMEHEKTFPLASYVYFNYIEPCGINIDEAEWNKTRELIKNHVKKFLTEDLTSACSLKIFQYDKELLQELESYYCNTFAKKTIESLESDKEIGDYINTCVDNQLYFLTQWVIDQTGNREFNQDKHYDSLLASKQFSAALSFVQKESSFSSAKKFDLIKRILCQYFEENMLKTETYKIFDTEIPVNIAEQILLKKISFSVSSAIMSLIIIYAYKQEWIKALFLFAPFKKIHSATHIKFIEDFTNLLSSQNIKVEQYESHFDAMRAALKVFDSKEFDSFIEWAKLFNVPSKSKTYSPPKRMFDSNLQSLMKEEDYDKQWKQLVTGALRVDNKEKQDTLRFSIIASFIGRYGIDEFDLIIQNLAKNRNHTKGYVDSYISLWKGLLSGNYSSNFLKITRPMLRTAPLTFWNVFYDIAVCKNHIFSSTDFELAKLNGIDQQPQEFFDEALERYNNTREAVFVKIALKILCDATVIPRPTLEYFIPYCSSNQKKDEILITIIQLFLNNKYIKELSAFVVSDFWKCDEIETQVLEVLRALCSNNYSYFFEDDLDFTIEEMNSILIDVIDCLNEYPRVKVTKTVYERIQNCSNAYQYKFCEILMRIHTGQNYGSYIRQVASRIPEVRNNPSRITEVLTYVAFISTLYKKQLLQGVEDVIYIRNRYFRILVADILLSEEKTSYSDDEIISLMQRNKHFNSVYANYKEFKTALLAFLELDNISEEQKEIFLLGLLSNNWNEFLQEITSYDFEALETIRKIESYTNYRDLNISFLKEFIYDNDPVDNSKLKHISACSPVIASVMNEVKEIFETDIDEYLVCKTILVKICHLDNINSAKAAIVNLQKLLQTNPKELKSHWDMYIRALISTSYVKTIVNILSNEIRSKKTNTNKVQLWQPVFISLEETTIYYYLLSVSYAMDKKIDEAKRAYALISSFEKFPEEWNEEHENLKAYLFAQVDYFYPTLKSAVNTFAVEKDATNVSFVQLAGNNSYSSKSKSTLDIAAEAYSTIIKSGNDDIIKYNSYFDLFSYVNKPEDLYLVYRHEEKHDKEEHKKRLTYNECVIDFGGLIIELDEQMSHDDKLDILIEMFDVFSFLNDINKSKENIKKRLKNAEEIVLETPGVSFEKWIGRQKEIKEIIKNHIIGFEQTEIEKLFNPLSKCASIYYTNETVMELLSSLDNWRQSRNLGKNASNSENAFIRSVDQKILLLKSGINLDIVINNTFIDDNSIFYQIINKSPSNGVSVLLSNTNIDAARLVVDICVNGSSIEKDENANFSTELVLRSNESCGQYYKLPQRVINNLNNGDAVTVIINIVCEGKVICNNRLQQCSFIVDKNQELLTTNTITNMIHYGTAVPAFSNSIKGFGREKEKTNLRELLDGNLAIIYGPSRVGKSSLLNYLANEYLKEYCAKCGRNSIMRIRIADEQYSKNDYNENMLKDSEPLKFETSTQIMEYLFCAPLSIAFSEETTIKKRQMCKTEINAIPEQAQSEIRNIISQDESVIGKYSIISEILTEYNCELWIMYDEFQQIVERWIGSADELAELCTFLRFNQAGNSIKMVFCGSDDLVRIFECVNDSNWDEFIIKTSDTWVFVGQLDNYDFASMMNDRNIWKNLPTQMPWNMSEEQNRENIPPVLQSLYDYTGGNAICGKIFGEELLDKVKKGEFTNRTYFYPSDITQITYQLLTAETSKMKNLLKKHTAKNLDSELPYLLFIASELSADMDKSDVALDEILDFFASKESNEIEVALKVLIARGIIKTTTDVHRYRFTTLFYFDFFKDIATDTVMERLKKAEMQKNISDVNSDWVDKVVEIIREQPSVTRADFVRMIDATEDDELIDKLFGQTYIEQYIEKNNGTNIGRQNNILNVQVINTAFNTLLNPSVSSPKLLAKAIQSLPSLTAYFSDSQKDMISAKNSQLLNEYDALESCYDENGQCIDATLYQQIEDRIATTQDELEHINESAEREMISDTMGAIVASDSLMDVNESQWEKLLGINQIKVTELRNLPSEISTPLSFAIVLHSVFSQIHEGIVNKSNTSDDNKKTFSPEKIDFCPVAIMYCKIVESMLKKTHTPLYINGLGEKTLKPGRTTIFADLGTPQKFNGEHKDLSIGSFASHLVFLPKSKLSLDMPMRKPSDNDFRFDQMTFGDTTEDFNDNIKRLINNIDTEDEKVGPWKVHARSLRIIQEIRNRSAHEAEPITKENFDWLIEILFKEGEFMRIWELSQ